MYLGLTCPWASGCLTLIKLKGLDNVISVSIAKPGYEVVDDKGSRGWVFSKDHYSNLL